MMRINTQPELIVLNYFLQKNGTKGKTGIQVEVYFSKI